MPDLASFAVRFVNESPRGSAILSSVLLDEILRSLIATFMIEDSKQVDELLGSETNWDRPIGTFSSRIRTAYCLGLLSPDEFHDLTLIRKIRNDFAHDLDKTSFRDEKIQDRCKSLRIPNRWKWNGPPTPEERFNISTQVLSIIIESRTRAAVKERRSTPPESEAT